MDHESSSAPALNHPYRLDPRPGEGRYQLALVLGWMLIIFSPFIAFTIHGKVAEEAFVWAVLPCVAGFGWMVLAGRRYRQRVPKEMRYQRGCGKVFEILPAPAASPAELVYAGKRHHKALVTLNGQGVFISPQARLAMSWKMAKENFSALVGSHQAGVSIDFPVRWEELAEWQVQANSDGPDYYQLCYRNHQHISLLRPKDRAIEPALLDYVRGVGQCPVRLMDDAG